MRTTFYKYQGTGNDFVVIDDRQLQFPQNDAKLVAFLCDRRFGIGADGLILLQHHEDVDFQMVYFNADGKQSSMCGNGGRCIVAFARDLGLIEKAAVFMAIDGIHHASIEADVVTLGMSDVSEVETFDDHVFLDTGSPHHIEFEEQLDTLDIKSKGAAIRYGAPYFDKGSNVNFVKQQDESTFAVRTYERGVEDETLSCGTGVTAVAIAMRHINKTPSNEVKVQTRGGELQVTFQANGDGYSKVSLIGPAKQVFKGEVTW